MNYKKKIKDALTSLNVPLEFQNYTGSATTYITYFCYTEQGEAWAENEEIATGYYVQVDIWSKANYTTLEGQVMAAMIAAGFNRTSAQDLFEKDPKIFHKAIRFVYVSD